MLAEQLMDKVRRIVVRREVRKHQQVHEGRTMGGKKFQRLPV